MTLETRVRVVEDLDTLREPWMRIAASSPRATPFQSWEWCSSEPQSRGNVRSLVLAIEQADSGVIGIAPLRVEAHRGQNRVTLSGGDYRDMISAPGQEAAVFNAAIQFLQEHVSRWDLIDFRHLHPDGVIATALEQQTAVLPAEFSGGAAAGGVTVMLGGRPFYYQAAHKYSNILLPQTWEAYAASINKRFAKQLAYEWRRIQREQPGVSIQVAGPADIGSDMEALFHLHQSRWVKRGEKGAFDTPETRQFHFHLASEICARGSLRLYTLKVERKTVAALYCFECNGKVVYYQSGFDESFARYSPMKLLIAQAIRDAIDQCCTELDMLLGDEAYKLRWCTGERTVRRLVAPGAGPRAALAAQVLRWQPAVKQRIRDFKSKRKRPETAPAQDGD